MNETDYNARLYEKMKAEQDKYRGWLLHQEPSEILNHTYEYIVGHNDGNVYPNGLISRAETATVFFRLLKDEVHDGNLLTSNTYSDVPDDYWANTAISRYWASSKRRLPDTFFMASCWALRPTRDTDRPTLTAGRTPAWNNSDSR